MNPVSLALIVHAHQPVGNFDHVIETAYRQSYLPFVDCLERHPAIVVNLHYSGSLLEWIEAHHPEYITRLRKLRESGRVELLGGGYFEPILISIPEPDRQSQIARLRDYVKSRFGEAPTGAWLAERVWEPSLPETLAASGVKYTLVDDTHFLSAGIDPEDLYGYYNTESDGHIVAVIPGLKSLRYLIPWRPVPDVLSVLARTSEAHPNCLIAMGDDLEKFGSWPETYRWVYEQHWLDDFFAALEANISWVRCTRASDFLKSHTPLGRVYLPTASYREMTEWWLPFRAAEIYAETVSRLENSGDGDRQLRFVNAGCWRNFLAKYSESNLIHKQMLSVSRRFHALKSPIPAAAKKTAYAHLLAAQCNDGYWHGVFGGLYAPNLRHTLYSNLIQADAAVEKLEKAFEEHPVRSKHFDLTLGGRPELEIRSERVNFLIRPSDGATVAAIHYKPSATNLINSLRRRPEVYHKKVANAATGQNSKSRSIHGRVAAKHEGLNELLLYDRYDRNSFRNYLFGCSKTFDDFRSLQLEESSEWAKGDYALAEKGKSEWLFVRSGPPTTTSGDIHLLIEKQFQLEQQPDRDSFQCLLRVKCFQGGGRFRLGLEIILNLLAGNAPDRYYSAGDWRQPLEWVGELRGQERLCLTDEWLKLSLELAPQPATPFWWICPIFSVSQSEEGFEKVYQGSSIMPVWELDLKTSDCWEGAVDLTMASLEQPASSQL